MQAEKERTALVNVQQETRTADVWHHNSLRHSQLFSDRAFSAFEQAGVTKDVLAVRCPVISAS
jgi:hypothetical protein